MGKTGFHSLSKLYLLTQSSSFLVDHRTTTVALNPTLCRAMFFFASFQVFPIFSSSFNVVFSQLCSSLLYPHLLFIYDCTITCMQIKFLLTLLVSMLFFFILFLLVSYLLFLHFKKNKYWLCALNFFNCLFLLRHCFSLSSCNCLTN